MGLHRRLAQRQRRGELGVAQPARDQPEHLELARRQRRQAGAPGTRRTRREPLDQAPGDGRREQRVAGPHQPDRGDQVLGGDVLEQEAAGPGGQRRVHVLVQVERGQHDDPRAVPGPCGGQDPPGRLEPVHLRHPDVHQHDVRPVLERGRDRLPPVRGLGHHLDARRAEDQPEAAADQRLVVGDDHPGAGVRSRAHRGDARNSGRTGPAGPPPSAGPPSRAETPDPPAGSSPGPASRRPGAGRRPVRRRTAPSRSRSPISPRPPGPAGRPSPGGRRRSP